MDAIYARQSIDKKNSLSIEGQIKLCLSEIQREARNIGKSISKDDVLIFQDKGFSGKNTKRPAFMELMRAIEAGQVTKLYVYRLDRLSRSISDFNRLWEFLSDHGVEFQSVTEAFDTSNPMGRAMLNIVLVFAQLERETTAERVKDNYIQRFSLGEWPGGPAPYGFDLTRVSANGRQVSTLVQNENAAVVTQIFEDYMNPNFSLRSLARKLTAAGIPGPKREVWDNVSLSRLLHSPLYVRANEDIYWFFVAKGMKIQQGIEAFDGEHACHIIGRRDRTKNKYNSLDGQMVTVANHIGFIPSDLWLKVQDKLAQNAQLPRANAGKYSWLTGRMKCAKCGYAIKINYFKSENKFRLICSGRSNHACCDAVIPFDLRDLEETVAVEIKKKLEECPPEEACPRSQEGVEAVLEVEKKIERLIKALSESSHISAGYISKEIERLHKEREELLDNARSVPAAPEHLDFDRASFEEKKVIAAEFIDRILLDETTVNIIWNV